MKWKIPPRIKVYEALGAIADGRVKMNDSTATVTSSSGNKEYQVIYDSNKNAITANDNGSYWQGYLGYPAIAFLMMKELLPYKSDIAEWLKGIAWKDVNEQYKNDFDRVESFINSKLGNDQQETLDQEIGEIMESIKELKINKLSITVKPPAGY